MPTAPTPASLSWLPSGGFSSAATLELMEAERVTSVFLVPAQWQLLRGEIDGKLRLYGWSSA